VEIERPSKENLRGGKKSFQLGGWGRLYRLQEGREESNHHNCHGRGGIVLTESIQERENDTGYS